MSPAPLPARLHLVYWVGPVLLCLAAVLLGIGQLELTVLWPVVAVGLCIVPVATAALGTAAAVATWCVWTERTHAADHRWFWTGAILGSGGLLAGVWWLQRRPLRPDAALAAVAQETPMPASVLRPLTAEQRPTVLVQGRPPLAPRPPAIFRSIHSPLHPAGDGPLAPTRQLRRRRRPERGRSAASVEGRRAPLHRHGR